jgi:hypothetical protein
MQGGIPPCIPVIHTIYSDKYQVSRRYGNFYWWWAHSCPKHVKKSNKRIKKNCAPSWFYLQDHTRMHGQQNLKFHCYCFTCIITIAKRICAKWEAPIYFPPCSQALSHLLVFISDSTVMYPVTHRQTSDIPFVRSPVVISFMTGSDLRKERSITTEEHMRWMCNKAHILHIQKNCCNCPSSICISQKNDVVWK